MALSPLARAIATVEGYFKTGTVAQRLNNPGNLIYVGQAGATPVPITSGGITRRFASWPTPAEGEAALERDLAAKARRGLTLEQTIQAWLGNTKVPNAEGDPILYTDLVSRSLGVGKDTPLAQVLGFGSRPEAPAAFPQDLNLSPNAKWLYAGLGIVGAIVLVNVIG